MAKLCDDFDSDFKQFSVGDIRYRIYSHLSISTPCRTIWPWAETNAISDDRQSEMTSPRYFAKIFGEDGNEFSEKEAKTLIRTHPKLKKDLTVSANGIIETHSRHAMVELLKCIT